MKSSLYYLIFAFWYIISLLPLRLLYIFSDLLYFPLYYCIRYRRQVVRKNLLSSFPEKSLNEILYIEKKFYSYFCDYLMETVKLFSMSKKQMQKRMHFEGIEQITEAFQAGHSCSMYLGHYCNWEWISSLPMHLGNSGISAQIYHPLENKAFVQLFLYMRGRFGATSIQMDDTFRTILGWKKKRTKKHRRLHIRPSSRIQQHSLLDRFPESWHTGIHRCRTNLQNSRLYNLLSGCIPTQKRILQGSHSKNSRLIKKPATISCDWTVFPFIRKNDPTRTTILA